MLVLMRHGQASFGAAHYDKLSPLGEAQARATGTFMRAINAQHGEVCIGPRDRHRGTARGLLETWGATPPSRDEIRIDEFADSAQILAALEAASGGASTQQAAPAEATLQRLQRLMDGIDGWAAGTLAIPGCETFKQFRARVGSWLNDELKTASHKSSRLVVTSAGVVACSFCEVLGLPDDAFAPTVCQVRNASLTEIGTSRGRPVVVSFNSTGHLAAELLTAI